MATTPRETTVDRVNEARSGGPRTPEGKARSSQNSSIHHLFSKKIHLEDEEERVQYSALHSGAVDYFAPKGLPEIVLVDKIVVLLWQERNALAILSERMDDLGSGGLVRRLVKFVGRAGIIDEKIPTRCQPGDASASMLECRELLLRVFKSDAENNQSEINEDDRTGNTTQNRTEIEARISPSMDTVMRCHTAIERSLDRTIQQLLALQKSRKG